MASLSSAAKAFSADLEALTAGGLRRSLRVVEQRRGARLKIDGRSFINFSSNNYLGLAGQPRLQRAVERSLKAWGTGATASRLIGGTTALHAVFESQLAHFLGTEAALLFPSGYMANLGAITALAGAGDAVVLDRLCHASLIDAARLSGARLFVFRHGDARDARRVLKRAAAYRRRVLVSESVFSMDGDFAPVEALAQAAREWGAVSVLDEAHALGVCGPSGRGVAAARRAPWDVIVGTLSKSLGSQGGFVAASRSAVDLLINKARSFIYTTGLSPLCVAAAQEALRAVQDDSAPRRKIARLAQKLRDGLAARGFDTLASESQIIPVLLGSTETALAAARHLWERGIYAPAIRPPTVHAGQCRLRFSVTAAHADEDIKQLLKALNGISPSPLAGEGGRRPGEGKHWTFSRAVNGAEQFDGRRPGEETNVHR